MGSSLGRMVGQVIALLLPDAHINPGVFALMGAASFMGGLFRTTVSLCVMLLEATG